MTKKNKVILELDFKTALEILQVLDSSTAGYSKEHPPERIVRLREVITQLDSKLDKIVL